jgi:hypothetical protein
MSDAISQHKRMAMGESVPLASGKSVIQKYANGGAVMKEGGVANLPAKGSAPPPLEKSSGIKVATYKKGGMAAKKRMGLTIAIAIPVRKAAGRGR